MVNRDVDDLPHQERDQRPADRPEPLPEHVRVGGLHVGHATVRVDAHPPLGRCEVDRRVGEHEGVGDHSGGGKRDEAYAATSEILVDDVRHDEHDRPDQHAGREAQRAFLPEQVPAERRQAQRRFEREDLHADELRHDRVADEERRQQHEQARGARRERSRHELYPRPFWNLSRSRRSRLSGRPEATGAVSRLNSRTAARAASLSADSA